MKQAFVTMCLIGMCALPAQAGLFGSDVKDTDEITPIQYAGLLELRNVDAKLFRKKLLPMIEEAMTDGKITVAELRTLENAAGNVAPAFLRAAKAPSFQDSFNESLEKTQKEGKELGDKLGDVLSNDVPKALEDGLKMFRNQMQQFNKENPEPPTTL